MISIRKPKSVLQFEKPSSFWGSLYREALPCGNGLIGAAVYGGVANETIMLTHNNLKWQGYVGVLPEVAEKLSEVRKLIFEGKAKLAQDVLPNALIAKNYRPIAAVPLPVCDLKIKTATSSVYKEYLRILNMESGEASVVYKDGTTKFERSMFVSRVNDCVVYEITKSGNKTIDIELSFDMHDRQDARTPTVISKLPSGMMTRYENFFMYYSAKNDDQDFGAVAKVSFFGGGQEVSQNGIKIKGAERVLILVKLFSYSNREKEWKKLKEELGLIKITYDKMIKDHTAVHSKLFNSSNIDFNCDDRDKPVEQMMLEASRGEISLALIEKMWQFGRYLFISSCREDGGICAPYGLWCGEYKALNASSRTDGVMQMLYSIAISGNLAEFMMAIFNNYEILLPDLKKNALRLYGCKGIFIPSVNSPGTGLLGSVDAKDVHFTSGAGMVANMFYEYYLATQDKKFLKERALPFMKEAVLFYEDFFLLSGDGKYSICPNFSPANTPGNFSDDDYKLHIAENATIDFAVAKELINNMITGAEECKVYKDEIEKWRDMLTKFPEYKITDDAVSEYISTQFSDNYKHRFASHLYPIYPGLEDAVGKSELNKYFKNAANLRINNSLSDQTAQGYAYLASVFASLKSADDAYNCLSNIIRFCTMNNLVTADNDFMGQGVTVNDAWAPYQIQGNIGLTAAINNMFVTSDDKNINILPALPADFSNVAIENVLTRAGVEVNISVDKKRGNLTLVLKSRKTGKVDVYLPNYVKKIVKGPVLKYDLETFVIENLELPAGKPIQFDIKI